MYLKVVSELLNGGQILNYRIDIGILNEKEKHLFWFGEWIGLNPGCLSMV